MGWGKDKGGKGKGTRKGRKEEGENGWKMNPSATAYPPPYLQCFFAKFSSDIVTVHWYSALEVTLRYLRHSIPFDYFTLHYITIHYMVSEGVCTATAF